MRQLVESMEGKAPFSLEDLKNLPSNCEACTIGKFKRLTRGKSARVHIPLSKLGVDLTGPVGTPTMDGKLYCMAVYDHGSGRAWVRFLEKKNHVLQTFKAIIAEVNELRQALALAPQLVIQIDGGEANSTIFKEYCRNQGFRVQVTNPYCSYQNGGVERYFQSSFGKGRANMHQCRCPWRLWNESIMYVTELHNNLPSIRDPTRTPNELIGARTLEIEQFHVFGSVAYVAVQEKSKAAGTKHLGARAVKMYYLGPDDQAKGDRFYDNVKDRIVISTHARYTEEIEEIARSQDYYDDVEPDEIVLENYRKAMQEEFQWGDTYNTQQLDDGVCHNNSILMITTAGHECRKYANDQSNSANSCGGSDSDDDEDSAAAFVTLEGDEPTYKEAMESDQSQEWKQAMLDEYKSLENMKTFERIKRKNLPAKARVVSSKWVLKRKRNENGDIERYKARVVARGFSQIQGDSYDETFAPTTGLVTTRLILILAILMDLPTFHFDVKTAYLYGKVDHEIYMKPPKGIGDEDELWRLLKSIYGLKQAGYVWNKLLDELLCKYGFEKLECEPCLYVYYEGKRFIILNIHVDDIGGMASDDRMVLKLEKYLKKHVEVKHLGQLRHFNGMRIERTKDQMTLSQLPNVVELLTSNRMENSNAKPTPMDANLKLTAAETNEIFEQSLYRTNVGKLMYICRCTRPDLTISVSILSRYSHAPGKEHSVAIKRLLGYLNGTRNLRLIFSGRISGKLKLKIYVDSDWAGCHQDRKSTTGFSIYLNGNLLSYRTIKQKIVALSSCEAEYIALATVLQELVWILQLLKHMKLDYDKPTVYVDNQGCIDLIPEVNTLISSITMQDNCTVKEYLIWSTLQEQRIQQIYLRNL
jgi:Reverse transcriptase (RNA-dependent DNA polymerase)